MTAPAARPKLGKFMLCIVALGTLMIASLPVLLIVGGLQSKKQVTPVPGGITATGTIEGHTTIQERYGKAYDPTIAFFDRTGHVHLFDGPSGSSVPKNGTKVKVSYDPNNPDHASDLSIGQSKWEGPFYSGIVIAPIEIAFIVWILVRRRRIKRQREAATPAG